MRYRLAQLSLAHWRFGLPISSLQEAVLCLPEHRGLLLLRMFVRMSLTLVRHRELLNGHIVVLRVAGILEVLHCWAPLAVTSLGLRRGGHRLLLAPDDDCGVRFLLHSLVAWRVRSVRMPHPWRKSSQINNIDLVYDALIFICLLLVLPIVLLWVTDFIRRSVCTSDLILALMDVLSIA